MEVPYVSKSFINRVFERMRDAERTNRPLDRVDKAAQLVHWMSAVTIEIAQYFLGAICNEAEKAMRGEFSRGQVEFVWVAFRLSVVVVMEMKRKGFETDNYAQLMGELQAAAFTNAGSRCPVDVVRGMMANKDGWIFMDYDVQANAFAVSTTLAIDMHNEDLTIENRIVGMRLMWQMFLHGYVMQIEEDLKANLPKPGQKRKAEPSVETLEKNLINRRTSAAKWQRVAALALQAKNSANTAESDKEFEATMALLHQSIEAVPEHYAKPFDVYAACKEREADSEALLKKRKFI
ncbi:hypothetical protein HDU87_000867 [Geranomyces variabilis]|uniref:Uncharacterized protein n=1 Tax=Geranomyces variabilis TaxID=109894 RepID=A0AAD5XIH4_9FUNG|nr:hypothetical protein HDU87_000867 [Geranomyces variabilis]